MTDPTADAELDLLRTYANGPRIWDAAALLPAVTSLRDQGLITPSADNARADRLTAAGYERLRAAESTPVQVPGVDIPRIDTRDRLRALARQLGVRPDWHEPDERDVTANVWGDKFDNAGFWGTEAGGRPVTFGDGHQEMWVELRQGNVPVAAINLATLLAWAAES
jgi:hypothetical protein